MCMLCVELQKEYMTPREIASAYRELVFPRDDDHWAEVMAEIYKHSDLQEVSENLYNLRKETNESKDQSR